MKTKHLWAIVYKNTPETLVYHRGNNGRCYFETFPTRKNARMWLEEFFHSKVNKQNLYKIVKYIIKQSK